MARKKHIDLVGERFGKLTVVDLIEIHRYPCGTVSRHYGCLCDCGQYVVNDEKNLKSGRVISCGCEKSIRLTSQNMIHGGSAHGEEERLYIVWKGMKQRCKNKNNRSFKTYGGIGVSVCQEWDESYEKFRDWALEHGYDPKADYGVCTIDRINPYGNYEPSNCRWISNAEQQKNKRKDWDRRMGNAI